MTEQTDFFSRIKAYEHRQLQDKINPKKSFVLRITLRHPDTLLPVYPGVYNHDKHAILLKTGKKMLHTYAAHTLYHVGNTLLLTFYERENHQYEHIFGGSAQKILSQIPSAFTSHLLANMIQDKPHDVIKILSQPPSARAALSCPPTQRDIPNIHLYRQQTHYVRMIHSILSSLAAPHEMERLGTEERIAMIESRSTILDTLPPEALQGTYIERNHDHDLQHIIPNIRNFIIRRQEANASVESQIQQYANSASKKALHQKSPIIRANH